MGYGSRSGRRGGGPPTWFIFLIAVAIVFGGYYLLRGAQQFVMTGGLGVDESTAQAQSQGSATAVWITPRATSGSVQLLPTGTPVPECLDFRVSVPNAIVRSQPGPSGAIETGMTQGEIVCVLGRAEGNPEWYLIDMNPDTRRIEAAYMNEDVIEAVNPTPTPSRTPLPLPTVTPGPTSANPTDTPSPTITRTLPPDFRPTQPGDPNTTPAPSSTRRPTATTMPNDN